MVSPMKKKKVGSCRTWSQTHITLHTACWYIVLHCSECTWIKTKKTKKQLPLIILCRIGRFHRTRHEKKNLNTERANMKWLQVHGGKKNNKNDIDQRHNLSVRWRTTAIQFTDIAHDKKEDCFFQERGLKYTHYSLFCLH